MEDCFGNLAELLSKKLAEGFFCNYASSRGVDRLLCLCCRARELKRTWHNLPWTPALMWLTPVLLRSGEVPASGRGGGCEKEMC